METMKDFEQQIDASFTNFRDGEDAYAWEKIEEYMENGTVLTLPVEGVVKAGVIVYVEGIRGFIPASQLSLSYVEDLNKFLKKELELKIMEADPENNRLILSAKALLLEKKAAEKQAKIDAVTPGSILEGKVDSLQTYGAFIDLGDGLSGLVHISQISVKRIKKPSEVLTVGDTVKVKVLKVENGKIGLSIKALEEPIAEEKPEEETFDYKEEGAANTSLASLLAGFQFED